MSESGASERTWLVLVHQLPPNPPGVRVRIWRRLQTLGALQLKSSVYLLPDGEETREDFEWLLREIEAAGAEATLLRSALAAGLTDEQCIERFRAAAAAEYGELLEELRELAARARGRKARPETVDDLRRQLPRFGERLAAIERRDFFGAEGHEALVALLIELARRTEVTMGERETQTVSSTASSIDPHELLGKTWVTRGGVKIDRTASAWLVRRFVDPEARFRFVDSRRSAATPGELRFDMLGGDFTHEGDACTFEVLVARLGLRRPGLRKLGEIVHDLDLKDERFGHPETAGVGAMIEGIAATIGGDLERIEKALPLFDGLLCRFSGRFAESRG